LGGLYAALAAGIPTVKINVVAMRGLNDGEMGDFLALSRELPITVRFIELMPFDAHQIWKTGRFLGVDQMRDRLLEQFPDLQAADGSATERLVFRCRDGQGKVALIPAYSRSICGSCNRIRITADGQVRNCLYAAQEFDLMGTLRGGGTDGELATALKAAMRQKPQDGWIAQKKTATGLNRFARQSMTLIGG
ncbi:MAG: cyclic pyranopterin phosphate synthase MoaA, partial [Candidatus Neomarinimicrobiota bacterium]